MGKATQELTIKQGIEGVRAKGNHHRHQGPAGTLKVASSIQGDEIRVTGKKRDDLQAVIAFLRGKDFGLSLVFKNFRD